MKEYQEYFKTHLTQVIESADGTPIVDDVPESTPEGDTEALQDSMPTDDYDALTSEIDAIPDVNTISNEKVIKLARSTANQLKKTERLVRKIQDNQLQNKFEGLLDVKFLPLIEALSKVITKLEYGVPDNAYAKAQKANK